MTSLACEGGSHIAGVWRINGRWKNWYWMCRQLVQEIVEGKMDRTIKWGTDLYDYISEISVDLQEDRYGHMTR